MTDRDWKGEYAAKLRDPRWQRKRLQILERDRWECQWCGESSKTLHVHHLRYTKSDPWESEDSDLLTVCEPCHESEADRVSVERQLIDNLRKNFRKSALETLAEGTSTALCLDESGNDLACLLSLTMTNAWVQEIVGQVFIGGEHLDLRKVATLVAQVRMDAEAEALSPSRGFPCHVPPGADLQQRPGRDIAACWSNEVGEEIAKRAQPTRFLQGVLFVTAATASWVRELETIKEEIRGRINAQFQARPVRDLVFEVGPLPVPVFTQASV